MPDERDTDNAPTTPTTGRRSGGPDIGRTSDTPAIGREQDTRAVARGGAEPDRHGIPRPIRYGAAALAVVALMAALGALNPPVPAGISTDRLGPEYGQPVAEYLAEAARSLEGGDSENGGDSSDEHWALLSFTEDMSPRRLPALADGVRIAQVLYRVPVPDVQTPVVVVQVPEGAEVAVRSAEAAAWQLTTQFDGADDRYRRVLDLSVARLRASCACAVGLVVRARLPRLAALAANPGIRAVQALPADAVAGSFAVVPLLPSYRDRALPGPDTGPVPES